LNIENQNIGITQKIIELQEQKIKELEEKIAKK